MRQPVARASQIEVTPTLADSPSMQFLPRQEEIAGWRLEIDPLVYDNEHLQAYLGSEGTTFLSYQALDLTVGQYRRTDGPGWATVEIFRFPDYVKGFGAYSSQKNAVAQYVALGNESFAGKHSVHIWSGPFYVRMLIGGVPPLSAPGQKLASGVAERMPKAPAKPAVFAFMPETGRIPNSERFSVEPGLGQPSFASSFTVKYMAGTNEIDGLVFPAENREAAARSLNEFKSFFALNGKLLDPIPNLGEDNFTAEDRYFGRTVAFRIDRFVFCFRGFGDRQQLIDLAIGADQRVLGTIRKQLVVAEKRAEEEAEKRASQGAE